MQLDFRNAFGTFRREACVVQLAATLGGIPPWLGVTSMVLTQPVVVANPLGGEPLHTYDGIPQGDPLSTPIFAAAMIRCLDGTAVRNISYIDDTLLMGAANEVADAHDRLAARLRPTGLELQPTKTKVRAPNMDHLVADPRLAHLERQNPSGRASYTIGAKIFTGRIICF